MALQVLDQTISKVSIHLAEDTGGVPKGEVVRPTFLLPIPLSITPFQAAILAKRVSQKIQARPFFPQVHHSRLIRYLRVL